MDDLNSLIEVYPNKIIGKVNPYILGQFIEHFPLLIYGGIYEEGSPYSDKNGYRLDVQDALKQIMVPLLRWPGGNYTSGYHWRWGAGPKEKRQSRKNPHWDDYESHHFGTTEFVEYCRRIGAEPLICVGVGRSEKSPTPEEAEEWVRYCNARDGSEAELRIETGYSEPLNVKWWGLGNECWGPWQIGYYENGQDYANDVLEFIKAMRKADDTIRFVLVGVDQNYNRKWNKQLLSNDEITKSVEVISWHHYFQLGYSEKKISHKNAMLDLRKVDHRLERTIKLLKESCESVERQEPIQIAIDEWNEYGWEVHDIEKNALPEQYDLAHALYTAGFLNVMLRKANNILMANYAPCVNIRGLIHADKRGILLRTSYHIFKMYQSCKGGISVFNKLECPNLGNSNALVLDVASIKSEKARLILYVINRDPINDVSCRINIEDFSVKKSSCIILTGDNLRSCNNFENPFTVVPKEFKINLIGNNFKFLFPKHSLCALYLEK